MKKLWRLALPIRQELGAHGVSQQSLEWNKGALRVEGVIYAIISLKGGRLYVGQTIHSCFQRFTEHVRAAEGMRDKTPLHLAMSRLGHGNFRVFPLEKIDPAGYHSSSKAKRLELFRHMATIREKFWIERLHSFAPCGFNETWSARTRHRPHRGRRHNPMKWRRVQALADSQKEGLSQFARKLGAVPTAAYPFEDAEPVGSSPAALAESRAAPRSNALVEGSGGAGRVYAARRYGYRDYARRCRFAAQLLKNKQLDAAALNRYARTNLWKMMLYLNSEKDDIDPKTAAALLAKLRGFLYGRLQLSKRVSEPGEILRIQWRSRWLRAIPLRTVLTKPEIRQKLPEDARSFVDDVMVVRKLGDKVGKRLLNFSRVARKLPPLVSSESCECRKLFDARFRPDNGCVLTGDLSIVSQRALRELLSLGLSFRTRFSDARPLAALSDGLAEFVAKMAKACEVSEDSCADWSDAVLLECERLIERSKRLGCAEGGVELTDAMQKYLSFLHRYLVLVPVDKAAGNVAFVCKALYVDRLRRELSEGAHCAYAVHDETREQVMERHSVVLQSMGLKAAPKLPYLYWLPKMHKSPVGARFIAGSACCTTTDCSIALAAVLSLVLSARRSQDDQLLRASGVRRFFVVSGYEEVADFLGRWPRGLALRTGTGFRRLAAGDFSTMYTTIPHEDLVARVAKLCEEAFEYVARTQFFSEGRDLRVSWSRSLNRASWLGPVEERQDDGLEFGLRELSDSLAFLIENTFLVNGESGARRQTVGIPMGTNAAPALANLYLHSYECEFIDRLVEAGQLEQARSFHMTFRFIDDVLSVDNPEWHKYSRRAAEDGGIYPRALQMNETEVSSELVHFLGMSIADEDSGQLHVDVFDKRLEFPFAVRRYPSMLSVIPQSIPYGVFTGQLHRYYRICTRSLDFTRHAGLLARVLLRQGCGRGRLRQGFQSFVRSRASSRYGQSPAELCRLFETQMGNSALG
jgi:hypothetical protein